MRISASSVLLLALVIPPLAAQESGGQEAATPAPTTTPTPDMLAFGRGAKAWADNCARCHTMRNPKELTDAQWTVVTTHMRLRAGLDGQQVRDISLFLQASN